MPTPAHAELLHLLEQERLAHFTRNADLLVALFADDFASIDAGRVTRPTREQSRARFQAYFDRSEFFAWDDIEPPVVRLSADETLAYVIVQKQVRLIDVTASPRQEHATVFAWLETWEKRAGRWQLTTLTSTRKN